MDPLVYFLEKGILPEDRTEARKIEKKATRFWLPSTPPRNLYRRSYSGPYLRCVHPEEVEGFLNEIHEGICGSHIGGRSLAHRALSQGYWWPYMQRDALAYVKKCSKCQMFAPNINLPAQDLNPISVPWPFSQWGMDIVGPFPVAPGGKKFLIVATDYFTKWVEAEALVRIRDTEVVKFVFNNIFVRFGLPRALVTDNGTQFDSSRFRTFCQDHGVVNLYSTPAYPQSNGQAEISNRTILNGLKKRLDKAKGNWTEELPSVLWAYRTTPRKATGETPFSLTYGTEAVIPVEMGLPSFRIESIGTSENDKGLEASLDLIEERREVVAIKMAAYQQQLQQHFNKKVCQRGFKEGDLVLRRIMPNTRDPSAGKLGPNWEGPYIVASVGAQGSYSLTNMEGSPLPRSWNVSNLRRFYI